MSSWKGSIDNEQRFVIRLKHDRKIVISTKNGNGP